MPWGARQSSMPNPGVFMQAHFPSQVTHGTIHRHAQATKHMSIPLASSTPGCLLHIQFRKQDQLPGSIPQVRTAGISVHGLCRYEATIQSQGATSNLPRTCTSGSP